MGWFVRVIIHGTLFHGALSTLRPVISYRSIEAGLDPAWIGVFSAALSLVPLFVAIPIGRWVDLHDERPAYLLGSAFLTASALALAWAHTPAAIIACSISAGIGLILAMVAAQAMVANRSPRDRFDSRFGLFALAGSAGQLLGPLLLSALAATEPADLTTQAFLGTGIAAAASLLALIGMPAAPPHAATTPTDAPARHRAIDVLRAPGVTPAILSSLMVLAAIDMIIVYLPVLGEERGIGAATVSLLLATRAGASVVSRAFLGVAVARKGRHSVLVTSLIVSALSVAALTLPQPTWTLAIALAIAGLGLGIGQPLTMAWVADAAAPSARGTAMALRMSGNQLGQTTLPLLAGALAGGLGVSAIFVAFGGGLAAVAAGLRRPRPT
ncbi:Predicted arabinose efflux permease, MFS family [Marinactinospora thermotolerans DSM 45154]|uniref:Predicted arabinose efflux permease, MFS family n=1 Tax=Marinactinospora thermotolerans DSM 45154 TaxID=1122192 RepID=A0A1T4PVV6_9ACTN|nr:MFS transporter [Marinactinospora thermotolerans]SJZ95655.1 Predicted arabinose efflux permease, MFS family [Marinactinospora thermotolerans DSM 45154]